MCDALHSPGVNGLDLFVEGLEGVQVSGRDVPDDGEQTQELLLVRVSGTTPGAQHPGTDGANDAANDRNQIDIILEQLQQVRLIPIVIGNGPWMERERRT